MGEIYNAPTKTRNGIITLQVPTIEDLKTPFYKPTLSGVLMGEIMLLALEQFTKKNLNQGHFFYELPSDGNLQFGRYIKNLEELAPNVTYVSEDYSVRIKRLSGGRYSFYFSGKTNDLTDDLPSEEEEEEEEILEDSNELSIPVPLSIPTTETSIFKNKGLYSPEIETLEFSPIPDDKDIDDMINDLQGGVENSGIPIPPPPPCNIPIPPPPPLKKKQTDPETPNKKKMRPLRWSAIPRHQLQATIWGQDKSPNNSSINIKERDLEKLFSISPINSPAKRSSNLSKSKKKQSLLPLKRANNISIVLSRLPNIDELQKSILLENDLPLSIEKLNSLRSILPVTEEDITAVRSSLRKEEEMSKAELFISQFESIPRLLEKINCLQFMILLQEDYEIIMPQIKTVIEACKEAKTSKGLKHVLKLIFEVGSILNRDTYLSSCGFRLQSLTNISDTKAKCGRLTLVHYLSQLIKENDPKLLNFEENEMPHCSEAASIPMDAIIARVKELTLQIQSVENELLQMKADKENSRMVHENFALTLAKFLKDASQKVKHLQQETAILKKIYNEVGTYFGEDPSEVSTNSAEFFNIIHSFSSHLKATQSDNHAAKMLQQIVETPSPVSSPIASPQTSVVDVSQP